MLERDWVEWKRNHGWNYYCYFYYKFHFIWHVLLATLIQFYFCWQLVIIYAIFLMLIICTSHKKNYFISISTVKDLRSVYICRKFRSQDSMDEGEFWNNLKPLVDQENNKKKTTSEAIKEIGKVDDWLKNLPDPHNNVNNSGSCANDEQTSKDQSSGAKHKSNKVKKNSAM